MFMNIESREGLDPYEMIAEQNPESEFLSSHCKCCHCECSHCVRSQSECADCARFHCMCALMAFYIA